MSYGKIDCINNILSKGVEILVVTETWANSRKNPKGQTHKVFQTPFSKSRGVAIFVSKSLEADSQVQRSVADCVKTVLIRERKRVKMIVIGAYIPQQNAQVIKEVEQTILRCKRKYQRARIVLLGDWNMNKFRAKKWAQSMNLKISKENLASITRSQRFQGIEKSSTLDYIASNSKIKDFSRLEWRGGSDHFPILARVHPRIMKIKKVFKRFIINRDPTHDEVNQLIRAGWPLTKVDRKTLQGTFKCTSIRPKIFLKANKSKVIESGK